MTSTLIPPSHAPRALHLVLGLAHFLPRERDALRAPGLLAHSIPIPLPLGFCTEATIDDASELADT